MNKGFTLIELLVVVLIIGILAAIALPQYTRAVERSRMAEAVQMLGDLATAESILYMQSNGFAAVTAGQAFEGDVQIAVPAATGEWTYAGELTGTGEGKTDQQVTLTAVRNGGMYKTGKLQLIVDKDGSISKSCAQDVEVSSTNKFCDVAATMGYKA